MTSKVFIDIIANDRASGVTNSITGALGKMATTLAAIGTAGLAAFGALAKSALNATAEYEQLTLTMESLVARELKAADSTLSMSDALGQAAPRAQELLGWIEKLAIQSPFDQQGVADAFRTALAYGFTSEEAQKLTQNMIDFAAGSGQSVHVMNQVALALGQIRAKGKLSGQEILQLTNAGISVNDILADMGYTLKDVEKGLVSSEEFLAAFNKTMEEDFTGAAKRATNSWSGLLSSLGDISKIGLRTLFKDTFEALKPLVTTFTDWVQSPEFQKGLENISKQMGDITTSIIETAKAIQSGDINLADLFVSGTESFKNWATSINWDEVSNELAAGIDSIDWAMLGQKAGEGAQNIADGIATIFQETDWHALFDSVGTAMGDFLAGLTGQEDWDNVKATWSSNYDQLIQIVNNKGLMLRTTLGGATGGAVAFMAFKWIEGAQIIMGHVKQTFDNIITDATTFRQRFVGIFETLVNATINRITEGFPKIVGLLINYMSILRAQIKPLVISISLPNPIKIAQQVEAILNALAPLNGSSQGARLGNNSVLSNVTATGNAPRAMGGSVSAGTPYLVGERGPEMFVPDGGGRIVPNYKLGAQGGGNIVVNLTYAPQMSTVDQYELQERLAPFIERGIRSYQQGTV